MDKKVIAIVGLPGSGKSEVIKYIIEKFNWPKVYFGEITFLEMKKRGLTINERNERVVREELRKNFGSEHYAKEMIKKIDVLTGSKYVLVESLYSWPEYMLFKAKFKENFLVIAVYASPKIRYSRLGTRPVRPLTPEEARSRDYAQIENLSQAGPIAMADHTIINVDSLEEAYKQIDTIAEKLAFAQR